MDINWVFFERYCLKFNLLYLNFRIFKLFGNVNVVVFMVIWVVDDVGVFGVGIVMEGVICILF